MSPTFARILINSRALRRLNTALTRTRIWWAARKEAQRKKRAPQNLMNFEQQVFSQNGEDGILLEIFRRISTTNKFFVELGVGYRHNTQQVEGNTRNLLENHGWQGVWIDAATAFVADARRQFAKLPLRIEEQFVERETIAERLHALAVKENLDLLSIDIDGNDYWVWKELARYKPRVVIMEYNGAFVPGQDWVMDYNPTHRWDSTDYFGASLDAYTRLGKELGYTLVGCDSNGINAFFVRTDLVGDKFCGINEGARYHYAAPKRNPDFYGFPPSTEKKIVLRG